MSFAVLIALLMLCHGAEEVSSHLGHVIQLPFIIHRYCLYDCSLNLVDALRHVITLSYALTSSDSLMQ